MSDCECHRTKALWLEVSNVRIDSLRLPEHERVWVQFKGDKADMAPVWWSVRDDALMENATKTGHGILAAFDKRQVVLGKLECAPVSEDQGAGAPHCLCCTQIRLLLSDSSLR